MEWLAIFVGRQSGGVLSSNGFDFPAEKESDSSGRVENRIS
ncbi:MAG: hypothetical protein AAF664_13975 [Planctomycetota bacterium]